MPVSGVPSPVICALEAIPLDLRLPDDTGIVDAFTTCPKNPQQELVILERPDAILHALEVGREKPYHVEHRSAARARTHQADWMLERDDDRHVAMVHEGQRRPVIACQPC